MANGARDDMIFRQDADRRDFARILDRVVTRQGCVCMSYCLD